MHLNRVDYVLWLVSPAILSMTLLIMCRRRLHLTYPYFLSYIVLQVISYSLLFGLVKRSSYAAYYYAYYAIMFVSAVLSMAVFWDIFKDAFQPYPRLRPLPIFIFRFSIIFIVIAMVLISFHGGSAESSFATWTLSVLGATRLGQCGLFLLLLVFRHYLGISRRSVMFGIALGFVLFALVNMLVAGAAREHLNPRPLSEINSFAYCSTTMIWLFYAVCGSTEFDTWDDCIHRFF